MHGVCEHGQLCYAALPQLEAAKVAPHEVIDATDMVEEADNGAVVQFSEHLIMPQAVHLRCVRQCNGLDGFEFDQCMGKCLMVHGLYPRRCARYLDEILTVS